MGRKGQTLNPQAPVDLVFGLSFVFQVFCLTYNTKSLPLVSKIVLAIILALEYVPATNFDSSVTVIIFADHLLLLLPLRAGYY